MKSATCRCGHVLTIHGHELNTRPCLTTGCGCLDFVQTPKPRPQPSNDQLISQLAEAKMHLLILVHGTKAGTPERARELDDLKSCTTKAKQTALELGSIQKPLALLLVVCEKAIDRFSKEASS